MMFYTLMMFMAPLGSYFITESYLFRGYFGHPPRQASIYASVVAVIMVHVVLVAFIVSAYREEADPRTELKQRFAADKID